MKNICRLNWETLNTLLKTKTKLSPVYLNNF